jgi:hypothetical protein
LTFVEVLTSSKILEPPSIFFAVKALTGVHDLTYRYTPDSTIRVKAAAEIIDVLKVYFFLIKSVGISF